jgi:hypothetical protein
MGPLPGRYYRSDQFQIINPIVLGSLLYLAEGKRDMLAPWARYLGDIAGVTNPKIVIVDLYNQQVRYRSVSCISLYKTNYSHILKDMH